MTGGKYITEETRVASLEAAVMCQEKRDFKKRDLILETLSQISQFGFIDSQNQMFGIIENKSTNFI